ncbi:hypothetical protein D3C84_1178950 [compost metagenome]
MSEAVGYVFTGLVFVGDFLLGFWVGCDLDVDVVDGWRTGIRFYGRTKELSSSASKLARNTG